VFLGTFNYIWNRTKKQALSPHALVLQEKSMLFHLIFSCKEIDYRLKYPLAAYLNKKQADIFNSFVYNLWITFEQSKICLFFKITGLVYIAII